MGGREYELASFHERGGTVVGRAARSVGRKLASKLERGGE